MTIYPIHRIDGSVICEIEADTSARAVEIAVRRGIDLGYVNLARASLVGATLDGASLVGASLDGASLVGASLVGASLVGASLARAILDGASLARAKITESHSIVTLVARATRIIDPYEFFLWATNAGDLITAGCHAMTIEEYRLHTDKYTDVAKREETLRLLDYFAAAWAAYQKKEAVNV